MSTANNVANDAAGQQSNLENLTFGVEFEFLPVAPSNVEEPEQLIKNALNKPVCLPCTKPGCTSEYHEWLLPVERPGQSVPGKYSVWEVKQDVTVNFSTDELFCLDTNDSDSYGAEVVSRKMNFTKPTSCPFGQIYPCTGEPFEWEWRTEIDEILKALKKAFSGLGHRLFTNKNAGLHVHVGNGDGTLPMRTPYGMFSTFTALERILDSILPVSRISDSYNGPMPTPGVPADNLVHKHDSTDLNGYATPLSKIMFGIMEQRVLGKLKKPQESEGETLDDLVKFCNVPAWLDFIKDSDSDTIDDFFQKWPADVIRRECAVNLAHLSTCLHDPKGTIEIRTHHATLEADEVTAWVDVLGNIALWVSDPKSPLRERLLELWSCPVSNFGTLARKFGASRETEDFYDFERLDPAWVDNRHNRLTSTRQNPADDLNHLTRIVEYGRVKDMHYDAVESKIRQKTLEGRYGQFSADFLMAKMPTLGLNDPTSFLCIDTDGSARYADLCIQKGKELTTPKKKQAEPNKKKKKKKKKGRKLFITNPDPPRPDDDDVDYSGIEMSDA